MSMPKVTLLFGVLLIALGVIAYTGSSLGDEADNNAAQEAGQEDDGGTKKRSAVTGLAIPATFGVLLLISGLIALDDSKRKHGMHAAVLVGTLGALATIGKGSYDLYKLATNQAVNGRAMTFVWLMALICVVYVVLCVRSFIAARKSREAESQAAAE